MQINPKLRGKMPRVDPATPFRTKDGAVRGWKVTLPGNHRLATPTVVGGHVFLGGGFGSYEFYALGAQTGQIVWQYQTSDDGPTAAIVADGYVVFNTESCELEVLTLDGQPVWKKWLGDPLMSMPAAGGGLLHVAFPDSRGDRRHYLGTFDLATGREVGRQPISGEVITAPVLADGRVYLTTLDGTLSCFPADGGPALWQEARNATSAPLVRDGQCYFSQRHEVTTATAAAAQQTEHLAARSPATPAETVVYRCTGTPADYLDYRKRRRASPYHAASAMADAHVGFGGHKGDAKMDQAMHNLGKAHVSEVWAHQGSRPAFWHGRLFSALGPALHCVDAATREPFWKETLRESTAELLDGLLTPPVVVNGKVLVATFDGEVCCLSAGTGDLLWSVQVGEPVLFQPAVAHGRVYATTQVGGLFCLETGDPADDGWLMWGAGPGHNGRPE